MNVRLPNGQVIANVPDGTSQTELMQTLQANGIHWLPEEAKSDPTEGTSALQRGWEAFGSTLPKFARGVKQLSARMIDAQLPGDQSAILKDLQADEARTRGLEKPLMGTTAGKVGSITGDVAVTAPAFIATGGLPAAIGAGMAIGAASPTIEGERLATNVALGAGGGALGVAAGRVIPAAYRAGKAVVAPFFESGQRGIAARTLARSVDDPAALQTELQNVAQHVPGSQPTVAEASQRVGPARLEKSLRQRDTGFAEDLQTRQEGNNAARLGELRGIGGTDAQMQAAVQNRETVGGLLYAAARGVPVQGDAQLAQLMQRPAMRDAIAEANRILHNTGPGATHGDFLHTVKMALDDMIATGPQRGIGAASNRGVNQTRADFLAWLEQRVPEYRTARTSYEQLSQPINQMETGRELIRRSTNSVQDRLGNPSLQETRLGSVMKNEPELLTPLTAQQRQTVGNVSLDLSRAANAQRLAAAGGSDTAQNLIGQNLLSEGLGGISPFLSRLSNTAPGRAIASVLNLPHRLAGTERATQEQLARLLLDPQAAARALADVSPAERSQILAALLNSANAGTASGMAIQSAEQ